MLLKTSSHTAAGDVVGLYLSGLHVFVEVLDDAVQIRPALFFRLEVAPTSKPSLSAFPISTTYCPGAPALLDHDAGEFDRSGGTSNPIAPAASRLQKQCPVD